MLSRTLFQTQKIAFKSFAPAFTQPLRTTVRFTSSFRPEDQPRLRIGSTVPNFEASTTWGRINFYDYLGDSWGVFFSHPADFTPVCTTELGAFSKLKPEFDKRGAKLVGLSVEGVPSHNEWIKDIEEISKLDKFGFPVIADENKEIAFLYDMVDEEGFKNLGKGPVSTIRSVYVIDPSKKLRISFTYPPSIGRNSAEVLRVVDALQKTDAKGVVTPIDWQEGHDVIIPPSISNAEAEKKFGKFETVKPYLRFTKA